MARKISKTLVIPTYTVTGELEDMALKCIRSHRDQVDTIIVSEDGGAWSSSIRDLVDIYVYGKNNVGFTKNVNRGWRLSQSDFTIIVNSDTYLLDGNIDDLCQEGFVMSPRVDNLSNYPGFVGSYWVTPKEITEKFGMLDERLKTYQSDMDYYERIKPMFKKGESVSIYHTKSQTLLAANIDREQEMNDDNNTYQHILAERK